MDRSEYVQINISEISQEFVDEYNLHELAKDGLTYFEITKGVYGLPQSGILYNTQLPGKLGEEGYFECPTTPGLWRHQWRPILFCLIVDNFGIKYVGKLHADHLASVLKKYHNITQDWNGTK